MNIQADVLNQVSVKKEVLNGRRKKYKWETRFGFEFTITHPSGMNCVYKENQKEGKREGSTQVKEKGQKSQVDPMLGRVFTRELQRLVYKIQSIYALIQSFIHCVRTFWRRDAHCSKSMWKFKRPYDCLN
jgi:hypothetical protein